MKIDKTVMSSPAELTSVSNAGTALADDTIKIEHPDQFCTDIAAPNSFASVAYDKRIAQAGSNHEDEHAFIKSPSFSAYGLLAKSFVDTYKSAYLDKFYDLDGILLSPSVEDAALKPEYSFDRRGDGKMEDWNYKQLTDFAKDAAAYQNHAMDRHQKIQERGLGIGGSLSKPVYHGKELGHFTKNYLMVKGYIYKASDYTFEKTIFELLPNFKSRKAKIAGIRLSETAIELVLEAAGLALAPVTLGISKLVSNQLNTVVTLSGEAMLSKVKGAEPEKIAMQTALRGVQLEVPTGQILSIAERGASAVSTLSILGSFLADVALRHMSSRYVGLIHPSQLGNSDVVFEMNQRMDYLSRFLIPYGNLMLSRAKKSETKSKLRYILAEQYRILRDLEQNKTKALHFYHGALLDERLPVDQREKIESDIEFACPDTHKNAHRMASRCYYTLLEQQTVKQIPEKVGDIEMTDLSA